MILVHENGTEHIISWRRSVKGPKNGQFRYKWGNKLVEDTCFANAALFYQWLEKHRGSVIAKVVQQAFEKRQAE
jgi:hypothetical protein